MDSWLILGLMIPITAIVLGHRQRHRSEHPEVTRAAAGTAVSRRSRVEERETSRARLTPCGPRSPACVTLSTLFDMSLEHSVERLEARGGRHRDHFQGPAVTRTCGCLSARGDTASWTALRRGCMEIIHGLGVLARSMTSAICHRERQTPDPFPRNKAKIDKMRAEREIMQQSLSLRTDTSTGLQVLKQQVSEIRNTGHRAGDFYFDFALSRLGRTRQP